ncbi:MAG: hypothetical protein JO186_04280, partial [Actinobacteria bacterium]|nr:hypothetical protein [Actinomycetota bacterium]
MHPSGGAARVPHPRDEDWMGWGVSEPLTGDDLPFYDDDEGFDDAEAEPEDDDADEIEEVDDSADEEEALTVEISTDSLQLFLKDIGKVDLLTAAQEVELAKRIERGDDIAKRQMVEANL